MARVAPVDDSSARPATTAGLLVMGMHRSGTSALARILALAGADPGARILGASPGNATGHWEDALAVEVHDRLLAAFGGRWDDPCPLPDGWALTEPASRARAEIVTYLRGDRARHPLWVAKDPRLCLFGPMWREAMQECGQAGAAVLMLRHPLEVASSLQARDGIPTGRALLLWLDHTMSALGTAATMPSVLVRYDDMLADWSLAIEGIRRLPGIRLREDGAFRAEVEAHLDAGLRHHAGIDDALLPPLLRDAWRELDAGVRDKADAATLFAALASRWNDLRELLQPFLEEERLRKRVLWERAARAEAVVAADGSVLPAHLQQMREALGEHREALVHALTTDLRRMQEVSARFEKAAGIAEYRANQAGRDLQAAQAQLAELTEAVASANRVREAAETRASASIADAEAARKQAEERSATAVAEAVAARQAIEALRREADLRGREAAETRAAATETSNALDEARAKLDQLQRERAAAEEELVVLRDKAAQLDALARSRSWRLTRPLRVMGRLLRGRPAAGEAGRIWWMLAAAVSGLPGIGNALAARFQAWGRARLPHPGAALSLPPDKVELPPARPAFPDVFVWAVIDWHFRVQRPQHLARAMAERGHRVFYVSNNMVDTAHPGFRVDALDPSLPLYQLHLHLPGAPAIYHDMPSDGQVESLRASLARVLQWSGTNSALSLVQHPYWSPVARAVPGARMAYDCMDHHGGFGNNASSVLEAERRLIATADLVVVTSEWLRGEIVPHARTTATIRNAGEFLHFAPRPARTFQAPGGRKVIGYYGAIAEWFDPDLIRTLATRFPDALLVLVGADTAGVGKALADLPNVTMVGEVPYDDLPYWLHGFDVCVLPFKVVPLTLATNPVKVYEYLAAGKPVVAVDLPEMRQFQGLVRVAASADAFASQVGAVLADAGGKEAERARKAFAEGQTWGHRAEALDEALATLREPRISVVVLTYNNLAFTEACLFGIEAYSDYRNLEVVVVDNASGDGSREWLRQWAAAPSPSGHLRRVVFNESNLGFAAGNNVGLRAATGDILVLLNNDTYVTPGWIRGLRNHLANDPSLGLVGPVTNNIGNEAKIDIEYADMAEMISRAGRHTRAHPGVLLPLDTVAFFCVAMPRAVFERVGELDERFGMGFFEDDDYCRRVHEAGYKVACAEDVFVHHHLSASFDQLKAESRQELFERNRALYEEKWGAWKAHAYRSDGAAR